MLRYFDSALAGLAGPLRSSPVRQDQCLPVSISDYVKKDQNDDHDQDRKRHTAVVVVTWSHNVAPFLTGDRADALLTLAVATHRAEPGEQVLLHLSVMLDLLSRLRRTRAHVHTASSRQNLV